MRQHGHKLALGGKGAALNAPGQKLLAGQTVLAMRRQQTKTIGKNQRNYQCNLVRQPHLAQINRQHSKNNAKRYRHHCGRQKGIGNKKVNHQQHRAQRHTMPVHLPGAGLNNQHKHTHGKNLGKGNHCRGHDE